MQAPTIEWLSALIFAIALIHTFSTRQFERLAHRYPRHAGLFHLLGEVEVVFGFWAMVLIVAMAMLSGGQEALRYAESRNYTEPLFVFVVMVVAASRPILRIVQASLEWLARLAPVRTPLALTWLGLVVVPLLGSVVTEPAAMTLAALMLAPIAFKPSTPERVKYFALGALFVNVSIGGTLTSYAAPPVLMVASAWGWDSSFMLSTFGWKAACAVAINGTLAAWVLRRHLHLPPDSGTETPVPLAVSVAHAAILLMVVGLAHHPVAFLALFLLFLGFTRAYDRYQSPLVIREALLVGFFLAGLVVLGGLQGWWLQPIVSALDPISLFVGALSLTAITDNAALTYLGTQIEGMGEAAKYMLVAGAVAGGGLTVIANAPNPAGIALLKHGFADESIGPLGLFAGALLPTGVAAACLLTL